MATLFTSNYSGGYGSKYEFKAEVYDTDVSIANNTSLVVVDIYLRRKDVSANGAYNNNGTAWSITIDGTTTNGTSTWDTRNTSDWKHLGWATKTITHNADGNKSITISASHTGNSASGSSKMGNASGSGTFNLTYIPRYATSNQSLNSKTTTSIKMNWSSDNTIDYIWYSKDNGSNWTGVDVTDGKSGTYTISGLSYNTTYNIKTRVRRKDSQLTTDSGTTSVTTYDIARITAAPNVNIGSAHTITWTNPSGEGLTLKLCKTDGTTVINYGTVTGTSKSITPTASTIYALTPNSNKITLRYILSTGSVGSSSKDAVFTVTNSNPTFSAFTYADTNGTTTALTGNNQIIVKGYSNIVGTVSTANKAVAKNSATMKTYQMTIGNKSVSANYSSSAAVNVPSSGSLTGATSGTIEMYALDSRGNSTKVTKTATIKDYSAIKIASLTATRTGGVGTQTTLKFTAKYWNQSFGSVTNDITTCYYKYKQTTASSYTTGTTTLTYSKSNGTVSGSVVIAGSEGASGFNITNSYDIQLIIGDKLTTAYSTITLGSGSPAIAIYKRNVAIGGQFDTADDSRLQVLGTIKVKNNGEHIFRLGNGDDSIYWKENGFGDKFKILPSFGGEGDSNKLKIQATTGNAGTNPTSYTDLFTISAVNGNAYIKGNVDATSFDGYKLSTIGTANTTSTWIPVMNGSNIEHTARKMFTSKTHTNYGTNNDYLATMSVLSYWNGAYDNANASNLTYCNQGEIQAKPVVLYVNASGTNGTVTLSETAANFRKLEILVEESAGHWLWHSFIVWDPNDKYVTTPITGVSDTSVRFNQRTIYINGKTITVTAYNVYYINGDNWQVNEQKIYKVVGYR